jgi:phage shock protein A
MTKHKKGPKEPETLARQAMQLIERAEREILEGDGHAWMAVLQRLETTIGELMKDPASPSAANSNRDVDGPAMELEQIYNDLQSQLIQVRQAVAQAIATEKQVEQQLHKNKDQAETWLNRAKMAEQQSNNDLAKQAYQRMEQYKQAATELELQLTNQKDSVNILRQKLTEFEGKVQQAYVRKQAIMSRHKTAQALIIANGLIDKLNADEVLSKITEIEKSVAESEAVASKSASVKVLANPLDQRAYLRDAMKTMQENIDAIARLEKLIELAEKREKTDP